MASKRKSSPPKRKTKAKSAKKARATAGAAQRKIGKRRQPAAKKRWSQRVTEESDALDLEGGVFAQKDPKRIAASLKRSAERSRRRKSEPYRSAMSMLTFYINRGGKGISAAQKKRLERAKDELRALFGRA